MYGALWRILPGGPFIKCVMLLSLAMIVVFVCFEYVFPAIAPILPVNDASVSN